MAHTSKQMYGLIGYPVKHSFSAAMHNAAFSHLGIDAEYRLFEVRPEGLKDFLRLDNSITDIHEASIRAEVLRGFNVTIPHKETVLPLVTLDTESHGVRETGAVNTVRVEKDKTLAGFNTDWCGFGRDIKELNVNAEKSALIGAGGAAKAVAFALTKHKAKEIAVYDIDKQKSRGLVDKIKSWGTGCNAYVADSVAALHIQEKTLLINASPVGMKPSDPVLIDEDMLHPGLFVYDLIYNPEKTKLLKLAESHSLRFSNGLKMLLYQGMLAFEHWTGKIAPMEVMFSALKGELKKCRM